MVRVIRFPAELDGRGSAVVSRGDTGGMRCHNPNQLFLRYHVKEYRNMERAVP